MADLKLGPLILSSLMISLLISFVIAYIVSSRSLRKDKVFQKHWKDTLFTCLFLTILIYKGSILIFRPEFLWENPKALLFFNGGDKGMLLALVANVVYLYVRIKKERWKLEQVYPAIFSGSIAFISSLLVCYLLLSL